MIAQIKELYAYREMIVSLVRKDLRGRYKGSVLGFLWTFINPLFQLVVDNLYIYKLTFSQVEVNTYTKKLFNKNGNIESVRVKTSDITTFNIVGNLLGYFLKGRTLCHILIVYAMNGRRFFRNVHPRVYSHGLCFFFSVWINLQITDFDDTICHYICTRCFQIEENNRFL